MSLERQLTGQKGSVRRKYSPSATVSTTNGLPCDNMYRINKTNHAYRRQEISRRRDSLNHYQLRKNLVRYINASEKEPVTITRVNPHDGDRLGLRKVGYWLDFYVADRAEVLSSNTQWFQGSETTQEGLHEHCSEKLTLGMRKTRDRTRKTITSVLQMFYVHIKVFSVNRQGISLAPIYLS